MIKPLAAVALVAATMVLPASAATYNVSTQGYNAFADASGKNVWYEGVTYAMNGQQRSAAAGVFRLKATPTAGGAVQTFLGFCLEPLEWLRLPKVYADGTPLSQIAVGRLGALVDNAMKLVTNAKSAAAFQLAAWEIANEGKGNLNLVGGSFVVKSANRSTLALSQGWLDKIAGNAWKADFKVRILSAPGTQDLVTDLAPVPVPAAGLMMMGALAGIGALRSRRKAA